MKANEFVCRGVVVTWQRDLNGFRLGARRPARGVGGGGGGSGGGESRRIPPLVVKHVSAVGGGGGGLLLDFFLPLRRLLAGMQLGVIGINCQY